MESPKAEMVLTSQASYELMVRQYLTKCVKIHSSTVTLDLFSQASCGKKHYQIKVAIIDVTIFIPTAIESDMKTSVGKLKLIYNITMYFNTLNICHIMM